MTAPSRPWLEDADFAPPAAIERHQHACWQRQRRYLTEHSPFFRRLWGGRTPPPHLADLAALPCSTKVDLRASQTTAPPFGDYLAAAPETVVRVHRTSGTTGTPLNLALSARDAQQTAIIGARAQRASGLGPGHRVVHCLHYQLWMGGYTDHTTLEATGATVVPFGVGDTERLVRTILDLAITAISCTPSYPAVIEHVIGDRFPNLAPRDLGLRLGLFGGEAALDNPGFRERLEQTWGFAARNANYGVSDVLCNFAGQCDESADLHFVAPDVLYPELIEPESGTALPWRAGTVGELVLTHLERESQPLVRFRTGDIVLLTGLTRCACGRTTPRFRVRGRSDDMIVVRGLNVFPLQVAGVLTGFAALSGEFRIVLRGLGPYDRLPVQAEMASDQMPTAALARAIADEIQRQLGVGARVNLVPWRSLPRTAGKTAHVVREEDA
ncbi:MAG: phenylacetate--CoA ligase [Alphaproteobacteria bacterium]|nr:phenylacetate--CoA ligase [Alphaproteobacteria bacterium]